MFEIFFSFYTLKEILDQRYARSKCLFLDAAFITVLIYVNMEVQLFFPECMQMFSCAGLVKVE